MQQNSIKLNPTQIAEVVQTFLDMSSHKFPYFYVAQIDQSAESLTLHISDPDHTLTMRLAFDTFGFAAALLKGHGYITDMKADGGIRYIPGRASASWRLK